MCNTIINIIIIIFEAHQHKAAGRKTRLDIRNYGCNGNSTPKQPLSLLLLLIAYAVLTTVYILLLNVCVLCFFSLICSVRVYMFVFSRPIAFICCS